ncbi:hypothetical protein K7X08_016527 [Anisodus acutangulus]|uniref:Uncharacterized protein n=1 Tax=Anisodus acutangulus TaxID=402998 RepID=A0A9Q1R269_9SOLA|nr:hypothetical protein K7X08_016527 [Anisodus acutangulus]
MIEKVRSGEKGIMISVLFYQAFKDILQDWLILGWLENMMSTDESSKKTSSRPQLVVLNRSFKLAEQWVGSEGNSLDDAKSNVVVLVSQPPRLGIGAAVPRQSETVRYNDSIERKLRAKLDTKKRKFLKITEVSAIPVKDGRVDE